MTARGLSSNGESKESQAISSPFSLGVNATSILVAMLSDFPPSRLTSSGLDAHHLPQMLLGLVSALRCLLNQIVLKTEY